MAGLLAGCAHRPAEPIAFVPRVDHHVHVHSPAILAFLPSFCDSVARYGKCDPAFGSPLTAEDLIAQMDGAGVRRSLVMSTAYLADSPLMSPPAPDHAALLRDANDFTAGLAVRYPARLGAFISVDPLADGAIAEIARFKGHSGVRGLKLHLTSSMLDLRKAGQVEPLARTINAAAANGWAIAIHMRTMRPDYGAADVKLFVESVLPAARRAPIQIAHAGGWGGIDANTLAVLGAFAEAIEADPEGTRNIVFDLADVWRPDTRPEDLVALAALMRRIGVQRFVVASDWPFRGNLVRYYTRSYPLLPLTDAEWRTLSNNIPTYAK
jgi:predicted TIM-barrel fold metal-dependent hydrolase